MHLFFLPLGLGLLPLRSLSLTGQLGLFLTLLGIWIMRGANLRHDKSSLKK